MMNVITQDEAVYTSEQKRALQLTKIVSTGALSQRPIIWWMAKGGPERGGLKGQSWQ